MVSKLERGGSATWEAVKSVAIARIDGLESNQHYAVTASITSAGHLGVTLWRVAHDATTVVRHHSTVHGQASEAAVTSINGLAVTATIDQEGRLVVSSWNLDGELRGSARSAAGSRVSIAAILPNSCVTAMRDADGHLRLDAWLVLPDGNVSHRGHQVGKKMEDVRLVHYAMHFDSTITLPGSESLGVFVRSLNGHLEMQEWLVINTIDDVAGRAQFLQTSARDEYGKGTRIAPVGTIGVSLRAIEAFAAVQDLSGQLAIYRQGTRVAHAGTIFTVSICRSAEGKTEAVFTTAVRDGDGNLKLINWVTGLLHPQMTRDADQGGEAVLEVEVVTVLGGLRDDEDNVIVTATRVAANDELKVTAWRVEPPPNLMFDLNLTKLRCRQTTGDQGSSHDEPYAVVVALDWRDPATFFKFARTSVFHGVDESAGHNVREEQIAILAQTLNRPTAAFARLIESGDLVVLAAVMESDDAVADRVRNVAAQRTRAAASALGSNVSRADAVAKLAKAFQAGLLEGAHVLDSFTSDDDLIGAVKVLPLDRDDLDKATATGKVTKVLSFSTPDEDGKYELTFELGAPT